MMLELRICELAYSHTRISTLHLYINLYFYMYCSPQNQHVHPKHPRCRRRQHMNGERHMHRGTGAQQRHAAGQSAYTIWLCRQQQRPEASNTVRRSIVFSDGRNVRKSSLRLKHTQLAAILTFAAEIKATSGKTKSLRQLISSSSYPDIEFGIKLAGTNLGCSDAIYAFPRFCAFLLRRYLKEMGPQLEERWLGRR